MSDNRWKVISNNKPSNSSVFEEVLLYLMENQKYWSIPNFYLDEEKDIEIASKEALSKLIYNDLSNSIFINFQTKIDDNLPSCVSLSYIVINKFEKLRLDIIPIFMTLTGLN